MFPLGSVLFPSLVLPLHVFEPRYRALITDVLAGDAEFGVCLIERGSEVGGDDVRLGVGTVAHVQEAAELPDGRWALIAVGTRRIVVDEWLPDDAVSACRGLRPARPGAGRGPDRLLLDDVTAAAAAVARQCWPSWASRAPRPRSS